MEGLLSWKRLCFLLVGLVVLQFTFLFSAGSFRHRSRPRVISKPHHLEPHHSRPPSETWEIHKTSSISPDYTRDRCYAEFPKLYYQVENSVSYWKKRNHIITPEDVSIRWRNDGAIRIFIHQNELRILQNKGTWKDGHYRIRTLAALSLIQRALRSATRAGEILPTIETAIVVDDMSGLGEDNHTVWTWASNKNDGNHVRQWLLPDFNFYSSPATGSYTEQLRMAEQHDAAFEDKTPKAFWRGARWTNEGVRGSLVDVTKGKYWADVDVVDWKTGKNIVPMEEHCKYAFNVHTEGRSYSGRLPFLLNCDSLPIIHELDWTGHFYHLLESTGENQNYIPIKRDFSDLQHTVEYYLDAPTEAQRIVNNSLKMFREKYLTPEATSCYIQELVRGFSSVSFKPNVSRPAGGDLSDKWRGVSFEAWVHMDKDYEGDK